MDFPPLRLDRVAPPPKSPRSEREETLKDHVAAACDKLLAQTVVERRAGLPLEADRHLTCLDATARWLDDPERLIEGWLEMARAHANRNQNDRALELVDDAVDVARLQLSDAHLIQALKLRTRVLTWAQRFQEARETIDEALQIAQRIGDENEALLVAANDADIYRLEGHLKKAEERFEQAIEAMEARGLASEARTQRVLLMVAYIEDGDPRGMLHGQVLSEQFQSLGMVTREASTKANMALFHLDQNDEDAFFEMQRFSVESFRYAGMDVAVNALSVNEAFFHLQRGRLARAKTVLERIRDFLESEGPKERSETLLLWTLIHLFSGDVDLAAASAAEGLPLAAQDREFIGPVKVALLRSCALLSADQLEDAKLVFLAIARPKSTTCRVAWRLLGRLLGLETDRSLA